MAKSALVAYFSASGVTASLAESIAEVANADLFEIKPPVPYSKADLDWTDKQSRSTIEMNDPDSRPEIEGEVENMDDYEVVFIGFPIWWYTAPHIMYTFLESYDFSGKTIVTFATSGGSGIGSTVEDLQPHAPGANFTAGTVLKARATEEEIDDWINELEF